MAESKAPLNIEQLRTSANQMAQHFKAFHDIQAVVEAISEMDSHLQERRRQLAEATARVERARLAGNEATDLLARLKHDVEQATERAQRAAGAQAVAEAARANVEGDLHKVVEEHKKEHAKQVSAMEQAMAKRKRELNDEVKKEEARLEEVRAQIKAVVEGALRSAN